MQEAVNVTNLAGIDRDTSPELQADGTYRFALNMRESTKSMAQIENMESNDLCIPINGKIIGSIYLVDKFLLFITDNITSEIGYFYPDRCEYEKIDIDCDLNFSTLHPIQAAYKVSNICDDYSVYWTDGLNPVRYMELGSTPTTCNDITLFNCKSLPTITVASVNDGGGNLVCGSYSFAIRYRREGGEKTSFFSITNPVPIYNEPYNGTPWRYVDGCEGGTQTSKSISLNISNLDTGYDYIDIAVITFINGVAHHTVLEGVNASDGIYTVTTNGLTAIDVLEIVIPLARWKYADLLMTQQNKLFLGGLQEIKDISFQSAANNIKTEWFTVKLPIDKAYKDPIMYNYRTFIGGEKYALGAVLEYCDGSLSNIAFHIPGPSEEDITCFEWPLRSKLLGEGNTLIDTEYTGLWDEVPENDVNNFFQCAKYVWEVFNTAGICTELEEETTITEDCGIVTGVTTGKWHQGHLAFSQECEVYPDTKDCDGVPLYPHTAITCETQQTLLLSYVQWTVNDPFGILTPVSIEPLGDVGTVVVTVKDTIGNTLLVSNGLVPITLLGVWLDAGLYINVVVTTGSITYTHTPFYINQLTDDFELQEVFLTCEGEVSYVMKNVRHHKFPSRRLEPHFSTELPLATDCPQDSPYFDKRPWEEHFVYPLGLIVKNIILPTDIPDIVGYRIVMVKRDDTNRSVIGKGVLHKGYYGYDLTEEDFYIFPKYVVNDSMTLSPLSQGNTVPNSLGCQVQKFHSPDTSFDENRNINGVYFEYETELHGSSRSYGVIGDNEIDEFCCAHRFNVNLINNTPLNEFQYNSATDTPTYVAANTFFTGLYEAPYYNLHGESGVLFRLTKSSYSFINDLNCPNINNHSDESYFIHEQSADDCMENVEYCARAFYGAFKTYRCNQYDQLNSLRYIEIGGVRPDFNIAGAKSAEVFGDGFINYWAYHRTGDTTSFTTYKAQCDDGFGNNEGVDLALPAYPYTAMISTICESDFNVDLRHEDDGESYFPKMKNGAQNLDVVIEQQGTEWADAYLSWFHRNVELDVWVNEGFDNQFTYNSDFSRLRTEKVYGGMPLNYSPCDCRETYANSIAVSDPAYGIADGWQTFRVNNIIHIPKNTGRLRAIFSMSNNLYAHTDNNVWKINSSDTQIQASDATVYLGTGDIFTTVPQYMYAVNEGFAGIQQSEGQLLNQLGYWFVDAIGADIITINESVGKIEQGLMDWLNENLRFKIKDYLPNYELNYIHEIGWHIGFDYKNNLVYVTKKDYDLKDSSLFKGAYNEDDCEVGSIYELDGKLVVITDIDCNYEELEFTDEEYFCNMSWTLSYSILRKMFKSWHSFVPDYYLFDRYNLFTAKDNALWKHNKKHDYQVYYNTYYPAGIELVTKNKSTAYWDNAFVIQDAYRYNTQYKKELSVKETFDYGYLYNREQNSGMLTFEKATDYNSSYMSNSIKDSLTQVRIFRNNDGWSYNGFADFVVDDSIPHNTCECLDVVYQIPNVDAVDASKPYYNISQLRGLYLIQRLYIDNIANRDVRFNLTLLNNNITYLNR